MADAVRSRILKVLSSVTQTKIPSDPDESLFESGTLDSFVLPDLVSALEQEFRIKVPDSDLNPRKFDSVARVEEYLADHGGV